jgi:hypothetical protein
MSHNQGELVENIALIFSNNEENKQVTSTNWKNLKTGNIHKFWILHGYPPADAGCHFK